MKKYNMKPVSFHEGEIDFMLAKTAPMNEYLWLPKTDIYPEARLLYDEKAIYVRLEAREADIRAEYHGDYDMVCEDSCLEFFFCPGTEDSRYFDMEINPNGSYYLGFGPNSQESVRILVPEGKKLFDIKTCRIPGGWAAEFQIPVKFVQIFYPAFKIVKGMEIRANFYKCGDLTNTPHYIAWNDVNSDIPDFGMPEFFGTLVFA